MQLSIEHRTHYSYSTPADYTIQHLRLTPQSGFGQRVKRWEILVNGRISPHADAHGNVEHTLVVDTPHDGITITAIGEVETDIDLPPPVDTLPLEIYLRETRLTAADAAMADFARSFCNGYGRLDEAGLTELMHGIRDKVRYRKGMTNVATTAAQAFASRHGVCQDHAHIFIACCRNMGIPARYVSGYLFTPHGELMESHAWADAWLEGKGWLSYDVSNGQRANGIHVRLATGLDYRDACPINGVRRGGGVESMSVSVQVHQSVQAQQ
jgi:transglutaminase-like putative cysteine protease